MFGVWLVIFNRINFSDIYRHDIYIYIYMNQSGSSAIWGNGNTSVGRELAPRILSSISIQVQLPAIYISAR